MRRSYALALAAIVPILLVVLLLPALANAAQDTKPAYTGTYSGQASGTSKDGKDGNSTVTIWVEDLGSTTRLTFQIDKIGLTVAVEGAEQWSGSDTLTVPLNVDKPGIKGTGTVTFTRSGQGWTITGSGSGKALNYEGDGSLSATMTSTGFDFPPAGTQLSDMFSAIFGGPPSDTATTSNDTSTLKVVEKASSFAPATTAPPITDEKKAAAVAMSVLFMLLIVMLV
jgi:hypothetical protein